MHDHVAIVILAGGEGTRLKPLTETRCKPAITFGANHRIIDVALSNAIHANIPHIYVITQFLASTLNNYIATTYKNIHLLPPPASYRYKGTADAVRKNLSTLHSHPFDYIVILSGDQLYSMDIQHLISTAKEKNADLLIATLPVPQAEAHRMGIMQVDKDQKITNFIEKPTHPDLLTPFQTKEGTYLGSMGIYVFKRSVLDTLLAEDPREDFGKHLIPTQLKKGNTYAYLFNGYWEDIGTLSSYYHANMKLLNDPSLLDLSHLPNQHALLPHNHFHDTTLSKSLVCEGSEIDAAHIEYSLIGPNTHIAKQTTIQSSLLLGHHQIGPSCHLKNVILDEHVHLDQGVTLTNTNNYPSYTSPELSVVDGIIIVKAGTRLKAGFTF